MPDKVLLVCSSTAANIQKAREILRRRTSFDRPEFHLLCSPSDLPYLQKAPAARRVWVFPHRRDLGNGFRLWLRILRQRYRAVAVLWCGDRARQRPKLFALACGGRRILVFDERLQCSPLSATLLGRLLAARARRHRWNAGPLGRVLAVARVLLWPLAAGAGLLARWLLIPVRFLLLVAAVLALYAGRRKPGEGPEPPGGS